MGNHIDAPEVGETSLSNTQLAAAEVRVYALKLAALVVLGGALLTFNLLWLEAKEGDRIRVDPTKGVYLERVK